MDTQCICRLCGKQVSRALINIFDPDNNYAKKINGLLPVYVHEDDCLPKYMCNDCHDNVLKFDKFYRITLETDTEMKRQISWMQKRVTETRVDFPMVKYLNSKTLMIATELENFNCYSDSKLPDYELIKTIDSNIVSVPVNSCPCSYSCSNCLRINIEDHNAFDQGIVDLSDSNKDGMVLDPLATEISVDVKDLSPSNNFICIESKVNVADSNIKSTESFRRSLRPRQKSTDLPPKKSSLKSKIRKSKKRVHFSKKVPVKDNNDKNKDLKIDTKIRQTVEIKTEKLEEKFKSDDKNLRRRNEIELLVKNNSIISDRKVKIDESIVKACKNDCDQLKLKNDSDNEKIIHGHINTLLIRTDNFNGSNVNNSIININTNSNNLTIKPNVTNKSINIKKECTNDLNLMDVSVKLEKINVKDVDERRECERLRRLPVEIKNSCKNKKVGKKSSVGKKRQRMRKKMIKSSISNNKSNIKVNINNLFETLNLSSSSGRVECDLCKKSFATREVCNLHYCCN